MELYIGGYAQGKRAYVANKRPGADHEIVDQLHLWFRELLGKEANTGQTPEQVILSYCDKHPDCILICDEIGNGIVPMDKTEREYRERLGRLLIELADRADRVERVICGIGQRLK